MWDRFSLRLWAARFFFLFVLCSPNADQRIAPTRHAAWASVSLGRGLYSSPTTFAAFDAIIPIAEPTVRATVWIMVSSVPPGWSPSGIKDLCGSIDSPPFPPLRTGDHVLDREFGFALRII